MKKEKKRISNQRDLHSSGVNVYGNVVYVGGWETRVYDVYEGSPRSTSRASKMLLNRHARKSFCRWNVESATA